MVSRMLRISWNRAKSGEAAAEFLHTFDKRGDYAGTHERKALIKRLRAEYAATGDCSYRIQVDHDPWMRSYRIPNDGPPYQKRNNLYFFVGLFDEPFDYTNSEEVIDDEKLPLATALESVQAKPQQYAADVPYLLQKYGRYLGLPSKT